MPREVKGENLSDPVKVRITADQVEAAQVICSLEGSTLSDLLREGLTLVIEQRRSDPNFLRSVQERQQGLVQAFLRQTATEQS